MLRYREPAHRVKNLPPSNIAKVREEAKILRANGLEVIDFSSGDIDENSEESKSMISLLRDNLIFAAKNSPLGYPAAQGTENLLKHVLEHLTNIEKLDVFKEHIYITNGGINALAATALATIDNGDEAIISSPYWEPAYNHVLLAEGTPIQAPLTKDFKLDIDRILDAINRRTKLVYINSPNNPTGAVFDSKSLEILAEEVCLNKGLLLVSDEAYDQIIFNEPQPDPFVKEGLLERMVRVRSFSKVNSATGLRGGYLFTKNPALLSGSPSNISKVILHLSSGVSRITQEALAKTPLSGQYVKQIVDFYKEKMEIMYNGLLKVEGVKPFKPSGGFYVWADISGLIPENLNLEERKWYAFNELKRLNPAVITIPGYCFGEGYENYLRFAFSVETKDNIRKGVEAMQTLKAYI